MSDLHSETVPYVAETMLPEMAPPSDQVGAVAWVRANLFSSVGNAILSILSIAFVILVVWEFLPWFLNGVWDAGSLAECRQILAGRTGACFAIIAERGHQFPVRLLPDRSGLAARRGAAPVLPGLRSRARGGSGAPPHAAVAALPRGCLFPDLGRIDLARHRLPDRPSAPATPPSASWATGCPARSAC